MYIRGNQTGKRFYVQISGGRVTKDSGNTGGTQEKINAAMRAGTEVIIIEDTGSDECIGIGLSEALKYITEIVEK